MDYITLKSGKQWPLNTAFNGDCLDFMRELPDKSVGLIMADPPYFEVKGKFDFIWDSFEDYLKDVELWAIECKRILADNGSLFWWGDARKIAYSQIIFDKYLALKNNAVWENTNQHKQQLRFSKELRSFAPITERCLFYSNEKDMTGLEMITEELKPLNPFSKYLKSEFKKAGVNNKEIAILFPSKTGGLTGCVSNWLNGDNVITKEQYLIIRKFLNCEYLRKEYEELRKEYEELRKEYEELRRPYKNIYNFGDVIHYANRDMGQCDHDTIKPLTLIKKLLQTTTRKDTIVFSPFLGSWTDAVACHQLGRNWIGCEKDPDYFKAGMNRYETECLQTLLEF